MLYFINDDNRKDFAASIYFLYELLLICLHCITVQYYDILLLYYRGNQTEI